MQIATSRRLKHVLDPLYIGARLIRLEADRCKLFACMLSEDRLQPSFKPRLVKHHELLILFSQL
jgi:hypothetical protein